MSISMTSPQDLPISPRNVPVGAAPRELGAGFVSFAVGCLAVGTSVRIYPTQVTLSLLAILAISGCGNYPRVTVPKASSDGLVTMRLAVGRRSWPVKFYTVYQVQFNRTELNGRAGDRIIVLANKIKVSWANVAGSASVETKYMSEVNHGIQGVLEYDRIRRVIIIELTDEKAGEWSIREYYGMKVHLDEKE